MSIQSSLGPGHTVLKCKLIGALTMTVDLREVNGKDELSCKQVFIDYDMAGSSAKNMGTL